MPEKPTHTAAPRPPEKSPVPDAPNDGFPAEKDVSIPPPESDVRTGTQKEEG